MLTLRFPKLLYQDCVIRGRVEFLAEPVTVVASAWKADGRPIYGAFFWINQFDQYPIPKESYFMAGAGMQTTIIIPSHDLVVVRLGHYKGAREGREGLINALTLLMKAVPGNS